MVQVENSAVKNNSVENVHNKCRTFWFITQEVHLIDFIKTIKPKVIGSIALVKNKKQESIKLHKLLLKKNLVQYNDNGNFMNGGIYFFKKNFLKFIAKKQCSLENDVLPKLIKKLPVKI